MTNHLSWLEPTVHRWNGKAMRGGGVVLPVHRDEPDDPYGPNDWQVVVRWALADGVVVPIGFEVHSGRSHRKREAWDLADEAKSATRDVTKHLPLGEVIAQGRALLAESLRNWSETSSSDLAEAASDAVSRSRHSPNDDLYRLTARIYRAVRTDQAHGLVGSAVNQEVAARLAADYGLHYDAKTIKRFVSEARNPKRGYLPPAVKPQPTKARKKKKGAR